MRQQKDDNYKKAASEQWYVWKVKINNSQFFIIQ